MSGGDKVSKEEAAYRGYPNGRERCVLCSMYRAMGSCSAVVGAISSSGWCTLFERKGQPAPFAVRA